MALGDDILSAVNRVESNDSRVVLTLLARVHTDILERLDAIARDESRIKQIALNGLTATHHDDHVWLAKNRPSLERVVARRNEASYCDVAQRIVDDERDGKVRRKRIGDAVVERLLWVALVMTAAAFAPDIFGFLK